MKRRGRVTAFVMASAMILSALGGYGGLAKTDTMATPEAGDTAAAAAGGTIAVVERDQRAKPRKTVTLRMWGGVPAKAGPQQICDNFNEFYRDKGVQVEYERFVDGDTDNLKLEINLLSGTGMGTYMIYAPDVLAKGAGGNMALDLSELMVRSGFGLTTYFGTVVKPSYVDGKPYSAPTKLDQYGIMINRGMLDEADTPTPTDWTYDEFREIAKKLIHGEGQGRVHNMLWSSQQDLTYLFSYLVTQTNGSDPMYLSEAETSFQDPVVIKSMKLLSSTTNVDKTFLTRAGSMTQKLPQESMLLAGKCAMTVGPWMVKSIKDTTTYPHDFTTVFASYPVMEKGQRDFTQGGYGDHLYTNPKFENVDVAWEFAKWYVTGSMLPVTGGGYILASNTFNPGEVARVFLEGAEDHIDMETSTKVLITSADNYAVPPITNHITKVKKVAIEELEKMFIGQEIVEDSIAKAKE